MEKFDYIIVGAGCSGLSLAYEMNAKNLFNDKTCAIIDKRKEFNRDKTEKILERAHGLALIEYLTK